MRPRRVLLGLFLVAAVAAGGCSPAPRPVMPKGPLNSAVPCMEACGDSNSCRAQCQPVGNLPPPPGILYQR